LNRKENLEVSEQTTSASRPRIRLACGRQEKASSPGHDLLIQREDGLYQIGLEDDAAGPFESSNFAAAVAAKEVQNVTS
jgi:hypothetical protein